MMNGEQRTGSAPSLSSVPHSSITVHRSILAGRGQAQREHCPALSAVSGTEAAAVALGDAARHDQPQPEAGLLGSEERLEQSREQVRRDARAGIADSGF